MCETAQISKPSCALETGQFYDHSATSKNAIWGRIFPMNLHVKSAMNSLQVAQMRRSGTTKYFPVIARHKVLVDIFSTAWMIITSHHCKVRNNGDRNSPSSHNIGVLFSVSIGNRVTSTVRERNEPFDLKTHQSCHMSLPSNFFIMSSVPKPPLARLETVWPN